MIKILTEYDRNNYANINGLWKSELYFEGLLAKELRSNVQLLRRILSEAGYTENIPLINNFTVKTEVVPPTGAGRIDIYIRDKANKFAVIMELKLEADLHDTKIIEEDEEKLVNQLAAYNKFANYLTEKHPDINVFKILLYPNSNEHADNFPDIAIENDFRPLALEDLAGMLGEEEKISDTFKTYIQSLKQNVFDIEVSEENSFKRPIYEKTIERLSKKYNINFNKINENGVYQLFFINEKNNTIYKNVCFYIVPKRGFRDYVADGKDIRKESDPIEAADKIACHCIANKKDEPYFLDEIITNDLDEYWISHSDLADLEEEEIKFYIRSNIVNCIENFFNLINTYKLDLIDKYCTSEKDRTDRINKEIKIAENSYIGFQQRAWQLLYQNSKIAPYMPHYNNELGIKNGYIALRKPFVTNIGFEQGKFKPNPLNRNTITIYYYMYQNEEAFERLMENIDIQGIEQKYNVELTGRKSTKRGLSNYITLYFKDIYPETIDQNDIDNVVDVLFDFDKYIKDLTNNLNKNN